MAKWFSFCLVSEKPNASVWFAGTPNVMQHKTYYAKLILKNCQTLKFTAGLMLKKLISKAINNTVYMYSQRSLM